MSTYSLSSDTSSTTVGMSGGCSYTTLGNYTQKAINGSSVQLPSSAYVMVPSYGMSSNYNTLQLGASADPKKEVWGVDVGSCPRGEYAGINVAYKQCPASFTSYAGVNCRK